MYLKLKIKTKIKLSVSFSTQSEINNCQYHEVLIAENETRKITQTKYVQFSFILQLLLLKYQKNKTRLYAKLDKR